MKENTRIALTSGRLTNIGAVVSLVQAVVYISFVFYFLEIFLNEDKVPYEEHRIVLLQLTATSRTFFVSILFFAGLIHLAWIFSSVYLLLGNKNGNERSVSQFVAITSLVNLMDIIFPFMVLPTAFAAFGTVLESRTIIDDRFEPVLINESHYGTYFWLLMTFIRGGCLTFAIDIFFVIIAYQRFMFLHELRVKVKGNSGLAGIGIPLNDKLDEDNSDTHVFQLKEAPTRRPKKNDKAEEETEVKLVPETSGERQEPHNSGKNEEPKTPGEDKEPATREITNENN